MARNKSKTQLTLKVPDSLNANERLNVATLVLQFISDRTRDGLNVYKRKWSGDAGKYTKEYAKESGKSEGGPVDLALSDEMLGKMRYLASKSSRGTIVVGFKKGTKVERKAEGNIIGSYGRDPNPKKARPFLDILQKDLNSIVELVNDEE